MTSEPPAGRWQRRARPLLGTLVEVGLPVAHASAGADAEAAFGAAFDAITLVQRCLSRFDASSDIARFNALRAGGEIAVRAPTRAVLAAARELHDATAGAFDISLGSGGGGWRCSGDRLRKLASGVQLDAGGIAKGHAVDCAVAALLASGCRAGWVNAGGDLRAFGGVEVPVHLRDEVQGGVRPWLLLQDGAVATSHSSPGSRSRIWRSGRVGATAAAVTAHVTVAAPLCLWADALTKVAAVCADAAPLLARHGATAWQH